MRAVRDYLHEGVAALIERRLDAGRSWFRYHRLFADLLQPKLRRTAPGEVSALHQAAAGWFAEHGYPVEAIRHAQAAEDWERAAQVLADHWFGLRLGGQAGTVHAILAGFPAETRAANAELAALAAVDELTHGSLESAERYVGLAVWAAASVPADRRGQAQVLLRVARLLTARHHAGNEILRSFARSVELATQAIELAEQHGWTDEPAASIAYLARGSVLAWQERLEEAAGLDGARRAYRQAGSRARGSAGGLLRARAAGAGVRP